MQPEVLVVEVCLDVHRGLLLTKLPNSDLEWARKDVGEKNIGRVLATQGAVL